MARKIFGPERKKVTAGRENYIMRNLGLCNQRSILPYKEEEDNDERVGNYYYYYYYYYYYCVPP
jgi:hypothetical protein